MLSSPTQLSVHRRRTLEPKIGYLELFEIPYGLPEDLCAFIPLTTLGAELLFLVAGLAVADDDLVITRS